MEGEKSWAEIRLFPPPKKVGAACLPKIFKIFKIFYFFLELKTFEVFFFGGKGGFHPMIFRPLISLVL